MKKRNQNEPKSMDCLQTFTSHENYRKQFSFFRGVLFDNVLKTSVRTADGKRWLLHTYRIGGSPFCTFFLTKARYNIGWTKLKTEAASCIYLFAFYNWVLLLRQNSKELTIRFVSARARASNYCEWFWIRFIKRVWG